MASIYFDQTYIKDYDNLSDPEKIGVFLNAIQDFYDQKINVYELSSIGTFIWSSSKDKDTELADCAMDASELEFCLHAQSEGDFGNTTGKLLDNIQKYYQLHSKNK